MTVPDDGALAALGGLSKFVRLSAATAQKQEERRPDIRPEDYSDVQRLIDHGMAVPERNRTMVFVGRDAAGKFRRAVVECAADARETYPVTFHRIDPNRRTRNCGARRRPASPHAAEAAGLGLGSGARVTIQPTHVASPPEPL